MKKLIFLLAIFSLCFTLLLEAKTKGSISGVININEAGIEQLTMLPGIGLAKAKAIQEYATLHRFQNVEELKNVKGIGDKALETLKPYIVVEGPTTATWAETLNSSSL